MPRGADPARAAGASATLLAPALSEEGNKSSNDYSSYGSGSGGGGGGGSGDPDDVYEEVEEPAAAQERISGLLEQLDLRGLLDSYNHWQKFPAGPARALLRALCLLFGAEVVPSDGHTGPRPKGSPDWVKTFCAVTGAPRMVSWLRRKSS